MFSDRRRSENARLAGRGVIVPDGGGRREDALQDAGGRAVWDVPAVMFEVELSFERVVDRLDDLAQRPEQLPAGTNVATSGPCVISFMSARTSRPTATRPTDTARAVHDYPRSRSY